MLNLSNIFLIDTHKFQRLFLIPKLDVSRWLMIPMRDLALWIYYVGILIVFYGSLTPWFLWKIYTYEAFFAFIPVVLSLFLSRTLSQPVFTRKDYIWPLITCSLCSFVICVSGGKNINGLIAETFKLLIFLSLFMLNKESLIKLGDVLSKSMAILLLPSMVGFLLCVFGFPFPHQPAVPDFADHKSFENYYIFMIDDRAFLMLLPRFSSVFLEPSHMAMACVALLMTQVGKWKKWYNVTMFVALVLSFSLAGYIFLVIIMFAASWMKRKAIMRKVLILVGFLSIVVVVSLFYNDGANLMNDLIIQRMVVNDEGTLEGDNRVTQDFDAAFEDFVHSDQLLTGVGTEKMKQFDLGNAGYKVFLYCYGLISLFLLILFFVAIYFTSTYKRGMIVMMMIQFVSFIPHGIPLKFYFFIPLYIMAFREIKGGNKDMETEKQIAHGEV